VSLSERDRHPGWVDIQDFSAEQTALIASGTWIEAEMFRVLGTAKNASIPFPSAHCGLGYGAVEMEHLLLGRRGVGVGFPGRRPSSPRLAVPCPGL